MRAVILNSGSGRRLGELTAHMPKCLLPLAAEETILSRQLRQLTAEGVTEFVMTTGPFALTIRQYVNRLFPGLRVTYVHNPRYRTTNYIYSLFLARNACRTEGLLLHGDMVFAPPVLRKLLASPSADAVLVKSAKRLPAKDFKGRLRRGKITEISVNLAGQGCLELYPVYKLSQAGWLTWMTEIERWVKMGSVGVYAEDAFNRISEKLALQPVRLGNRLCMEIDTAEDLCRARQRVERETA